MDIDFLNNGINLEIEETLDEVEQHIHIRIQKRNGRKCWTHIENLEYVNHKKEDKFMAKIAKEFRKMFNCSASIKKKENIIQLQGDHRFGVRDYLVDNKLIKKDNIKIHGY